MTEQQKIYDKNKNMLAPMGGKGMEKNSERDLIASDWVIVGFLYVCVLF